MKTIEAFLSDLRRKNIKLWLDDDNLCYKAPPNTLTPSLLKELKERKSEIVAFLNNAKATTGRNLSPILPAPRDQEVILSFAQQRLWFLNQLEGKSTTYNIIRAWRLEGNLSLRFLEQAFNEILRRHEILRTTFARENGVPIQVIASTMSTPLSVIDLQQLLEAEQHVQVQNFVKQEAEKSFDLERCPLFRVSLLKLGSQSHVLILTMHHIISDGWSMGLLWRELSALYQAFSNGEHSPLEPLSIQYADFALWQRQWFKGNLLETQINYWKQQLEGAPPLLELPYDRPRPPIKKFRGGREPFKLPVKLSHQLHNLSQKSDCTLFMTLLAAWSSLLYRYSGQSDILIGTPIAHRNRREIEPLIGFFVNTLVMRTQFQEHLSFLEVLKRVRQTAIEAYAHQDIPFEQLVEELQPQRSLSYSPLFQAMFALRSDVMGNPDFPGLTWSRLEIKSVAAKFDLFLSMKETQEGLIGYWEYNSDLFDRATIRRWMSHFQVLLEGIVDNPQQQISQLHLLTEGERHQILVEWNNTATDYPQDKCIHQLFEEQVERNPDAVAVVFEDQQLTYRQLNNRANQLAHYLQSLGVKSEVLVGICVERSFEMVVGLLGILKAGGAYVPLDPNYPQERIAYMLEDSAVSVLLTEQKLLTSLPSHQASVVCWDIESERINCESEENLTTLVTPEQLSYINYTSGSTGVPKGVEVTHRGVTRLLFGVNYANLDTEQTFVQIAPISFDASTFEIWGALLHGSRCVIFAEKIPTSKDLSYLITKNKITTLWLTSTLFNTIIDEDPEALSGIRQLLIGGEALSVSHVRRGLNALPSTQIINGYGPTENTTFTCCYAIPSPLDSQAHSIPIGRPIANTQTYILDQYLQPVPIGIPGELHIGGAGLARGYLNRPKLTQEKFISNPFDKETGSRLYKTGDLARYLRDGNIEFLSRIDNQVKIRGFRIELGEIEATINTHPQIKETVVITREDIPGNKRLVAYLVTDESLNTKQLREFLKEKLPEYMVPSAFVTLDTLPLTPSGKINRRALPAPDKLSIQLETKFAPPTNPIEQTLANIWVEVLGVKKVGIYDNFFDLGGHSLLAVRLVAQIEKVTHKKLPLAALFQFTTISEIAHLLEEKEAADYTKSRLSPELQKLDADDLRDLLTIVAGREGTKPRPDSLMVAIRSTGVKPPLFYVANSASEFSGIAHYLEEEQPLYLLESGYFILNQEGKCTQENIQAIAAHHVHDILAVYPEGLILLTGYSFGRFVAYEVAKQLQERDREVSLFLLDTFGTGVDYRYYRQRIEPNLVSIKKNLLHGRLFDFTSNFALLLSQLKDYFITQKYVLFMEAHKQEYLMQGYFGKVTILAARSSHTRNLNIKRWLFPKMGWSKHVVNIIKVPGDHHSMITEPHVQVLADKLKACIEQAIYS